MNADDAAKILEALAKGIDPDTGELFPEDSPLSSRHVIRALFLGVSALRQATPSVEAARRIPEEGIEQPWKAWTKEEEGALLAAFHRGDPIQVIAEAHKRKPGGITSRLAKLGHIKRPGGETSDA